MTRVSHTALRLMAGILPSLAASVAFAQDDEAPFDRTAQKCIIASQIDGTEAIDDQTIIFRMRGKRVYRNTLPRTCPGLLRENRIFYETRSSQLCNVDTITVMEQFGVSFRPGFTCRLGEFVPLSPADVEDLAYRKKNGGAASQSAIETNEVDVEAEGEAADSDEVEPVPTDDAAEAPNEPQ